MRGRIRATTVLATIAAVAVPVATVAAGAGATTADAATPAAHAAAAAATVKIGKTSAGKILETGSGFVVYEFTADSKGHDACITKSGCSSIWPPLTVKGSAVAGAGVKASLLGTISIGKNRKQVTYAGHPLYLYAGASAGSAGYLGASSFGGSWYGLTATGAAVH